MFRSRSWIILILSLALLLILPSCKDSVEEKDESAVYAPGEINEGMNETVGEWITDPTGHFSYLYINPYKYFGIVFDEDMVFSEDMFIYSTIARKTGEKIQYGYMDQDYKRCTAPISLQPSVFAYGLARIYTEDGSYVINTDFQKMEEYYPGYVLHNNALIVVDWSDKLYHDPLIIPDIDPDKYIVPYKVYPEDDKSISTPKVGFKTITDAYFSDKRPEDEFVIQPVYQEAGLFKDGVAPVKKDDKWGFINTEGHIVINHLYDGAKSLGSGVIGLCFTEGKSYTTSTADGERVRMYYSEWALFDTSGTQLTDFEFYDISDFSEGIGFLGDNNIKMYDTAGNNLSQWWMGYNSEGPPRFHEGLIALRSNYRYYFFDRTGKYVFPNGYNDAKNFSNGMAAVYNHMTEKWGYINIKGERTIPYTYSAASDFNQGYAYVSEGEGYIKEGSSEMFYPPGFLIDKHQNKYLKDLNLLGITRFNEDGYALGYAIQQNWHWVNINEHDINRFMEPVYEQQLIDDKVYYMIHIE